MSEKSSPWFLRWLARAPSRWLGRSSELRQDLRGGSHGLAYLRHLARGNRLKRNATLDAAEQGGEPPVLLIHGFLGTRGSMYVLERRLQDDGITVFSFNLGTLNSRDIRRSAFLIHRKIERILAQTSVDKIDIIGHSMGGLIGLYYIKKLGGHARVRKLLMIGSPVRGTWVALLGIATLGLWSTSSWQLLPRSRFLDELAEGPIPGGVEVHTVAAARDWVCPLPSTRLRDAHNVTVPLGHSSLVVAPQVYKRLMSILRPDSHLRVVPDDTDSSAPNAGDSQSSGDGSGPGERSLKNTGRGNK